MRAINSSTVGSPVRIIAVLNLNRCPASTDQAAASAGDLVLPHRVADHCVDINAVEYPMELFGRKRDHRQDQHITLQCRTASDRH